MAELDEKQFLRQRKPTRPDGAVVPFRSPPGWTHFLIAAAKLAHALLPEPNKTWTDALDAFVGMAENYEDDEDTAAHLVAEYLTTFISDACATETLLTGYRPVGGGGEVVIMSGSLWELEDPGLRFRTWSFDPERPFSTDSNLPCWIWVETKSLERQLERIDRYRNRRSIRAVYEGDWLDLPSAMERVSSIAASDLEKLGALRWLCLRGGCQAVASEYVRTYAGQPVERDVHCGIGQELWLVIDPVDPRHRLSESTLYATAGSSDYEFIGVNFDGTMLSETLDNSAIPKTRASAHGARAPAPSRPQPSDEEILARCDELHGQGYKVRDLDKMIPKEDRFAGVKSMTVRELTKGRYPRVGRAGILGQD